MHCICSVHVVKISEECLQWTIIRTFVKMMCLVAGAIIERIIMQAIKTIKAQGLHILNITNIVEALNKIKQLYDVHL